MNELFLVDVFIREPSALLFLLGDDSFIAFLPALFLEVEGMVEHALATDDVDARRGFEVAGLAEPGFFEVLLQVLACRRDEERACLRGRALLVVGEIADLHVRLGPHDKHGDLEPPTVVEDIGVDLSEALW